MKKRLVTYGISGLMECQVVIKIGNRSKMKVLFTDGSMTAHGVTPAQFTTDNFMVQHAIEQSVDYKRGYIFTVSSFDLKEDVKIGGSQEVKATENELPLAPKPIVTKVSISDPDAAKTYLAETFGVNRAKLKTIKAIKDEAMANNVEFEGL